MTGPIIQLIAWTTMYVFETVMKIFPRPLTVDPKAQERYYIAEFYFHRMANRANTTSYRIAQIMTASYVHAPLCPLPAELPYLVPKMTWQCLVMVYRQVRMMSAERQIVEDLPDPNDIMDVGPIYQELRLEAERQADEDLMDEDLNDIMANQLGNVDVRDNIMVQEVDNIVDDEPDNMFIALQHFHLGPGR